VEVSSLACLPDDYPIDLKVGDEIDHRDFSALGKWIKARILSIELLTLEVEFGLQTKKLNLIQDRDLLAPLGTYTEKKPDENYLSVSKGDFISVWALQPTDLRQWTQGEVIEVNSNQTQALVKYENWGSNYRTWHPLNRNPEFFEICRMEEMEFKQIPSAEFEQTLSFRLTLIRGGMLRVLDSRGFWCMAQIINKDSFGGLRLQIHYERWTSKFDEWICLNTSAFRAISISECDTQPESYRTEENAIQDEADLYFKKKLNEKEMDFVAVSKDGNCLYRSFAHQIYGDFSRHEEIRGLCCQYMVNYISLSL
jgi:hypothetical protein